MCVCFGSMAQTYQVRETQRVEIHCIKCICQCQTHFPPMWYATKNKLYYSCMVQWYQNIEKLKPLPWVDPTYPTLILVIGAAYIRITLEFAFTQLLEKDYCLKHHHKTDYWNFGTPAKSILDSFSSHWSKSSHFTSMLIQINSAMVVYLIYLSQNNATTQKSLDYATLT